MTRKTPPAPKRLGSGAALKGLLGDALPGSTDEADHPAQVRALPLARITPNPYQPRHNFDAQELRELADSIESYGQRTPIEVRPNPQHPGQYQIIAGERRVRALRLLKRETVDALVRTEEDRSMLLLALVENLQRIDLNPIDEALGCRQLMQDFSLTQEEVAQRICKGRSTVTNLLRLLGLPDPVQELVRTGQLSQGHAKLLLPVPGPQAIALAQRCVAEDLSVMQLQALLDHVGGSTGKRKTTGNGSATGKGSGRPAGESDPFITALEDDLRTHFGTRVRISHQANNTGSILIEYFGLEEMEGILEKMGVPASR